MTQLADEILIAYADGELDPAQNRLVDGVLAADGPTLERLSNQQALNQRLTQAFSSMLQAESRQAVVEAMANTSHKADQKTASKRVRPPMIASRNILVPAFTAGALLLAVGGLGGYMAGHGSQGDKTSDPFGSSNFWHNDQARREQKRSTELLNKIASVASKNASTPLRAPKTTAATVQTRIAHRNRWYEAVAAHHKKMAARLIDRYKGKSRNRELALFQFNHSAAAPPLIPLLKEEQLVFIGASPLIIKGQAYARLSYRDRDNGAVPVGLYVSTNHGGSLTLERGYDGDDNYVRWTQGHRSYMLIGPVPHWRLIVLSVAVQRQVVE